MRQSNLKIGNYKNYKLIQSVGHYFSVLILTIGLSSVQAAGIGASSAANSMDIMASAPLLTQDEAESIKGGYFLTARNAPGGYVNVATPYAGLGQLTTLIRLLSGGFNPGSSGGNVFNSNGWAIECYDASRSFVFRDWNDNIYINGRNMGRGTTIQALNGYRNIYLFDR